MQWYIIMWYKFLPWPEIYKDMVVSDFTIEKVQNISNDIGFITEFLNLSYTSMLEARKIFKDSIKTRNLTAYRQIAHKIKTNLMLLGLSKLHSLIVSGKELFETSDDKQLEQFSDTLELNINVVIERVSILRNEMSNLKS